ncbi:MAG: hypothetical protein PVG25_05915 [Anaerolineae bacterium]
MFPVRWDAIVPGNCKAAGLGKLWVRPSIMKRQDSKHEVPVI